VRPDDLTVGAGAPIVSGRVAVREPLGAETLIYVETEAGEVIAKASGRTPPEVGAEVTLSAELANLHVFDAETKAALR
jgi:multiple sugar transport system ATP-binding protein